MDPDCLKLPTNGLVEAVPFTRDPVHSLTKLEPLDAARL